MRYASVCDGIGAVHEAWKPLGWTCAWTSEIAPFPSAVVEQRHGLPNLGDMTTLEVPDGPALDLLVGGTPCQAFSVAGLRGGMADPRGNLALVFLGLVDRLRPRWVVWENVPGVLSSWTSIDEEEEASDFGCFLAGLEQLGYGVFSRVLDAQYFGLAQRRKRVFVVGHAGGVWQRACAVLLERACLRGDPPPSREAGQGAAGTLGASLAKCGTVQDAYQGQLIAGTLGTRRGPGPDEAKMGLLVPTVARALCAGNQRLDGTVETLVFDPTQITSATNRSNPQPGDPCHTLPAHGVPPTMAFYSNQGSQGIGDGNDLSPPLKIGGGSGAGGPVAAATPQGVRRLTPRECERLQGFPDDYTAITYRGKAAADGPRYCALGNSMAVPVMAWIGRRIAAVDAIPS